MADAICFKCGFTKRNWDAKCRKCGFSPINDTESMAKSYILSIDRYDEGNAPEDRMKIRDFEEDELDEIGEKIRRGEHYKFDPEEVRQVAQVFELAKQANWKDAVKMFLGLMWWLAPLWIIIAIGLILFFSR